MLRLDLGGHGLGSWAIDINQDRYATHFSNGLGVPYSEQARATSDDCDPAREVERFSYTQTRTSKAIKAVWRAGIARHLKQR
jgi:hypothetical protein